MDKRIIRTIDILDQLDEPDIRDIVSNMLYSQYYRESESIKDIVNLIKNSENGSDKTGKFILRCPTGKAAEEFFRDYHAQNNLPVKGNLFDCRDLGCGYDYKIVDTDLNEVYIEVMGISAVWGGILFTDKEWKIAKEQKSKYFLCIVKNLNDTPVLRFINNTAQFFKPVKNIRTTIQINYAVSDKDLKSIYDNS